MSLVAPTLQSFFTDRLVNQRRASPRTIASYRDSLKLLVTFVHAKSGKTPAQLDSTTSRPNATTGRGRATCGSPRSVRCSPTRRSATLSTRR
jgi:site-specific recombinase XerC